MREFKLNKKSLEMQEFNLKIQLQGINLQNLKEKRQRAEDAMKRRIKEMKERNLTDNRAT